jgi:hypothetical protein
MAESSERILHMRRWMTRALLVAALAAGIIWYRERPTPVIEEAPQAPELVHPSQLTLFDGPTLTRQELLAGLALHPGQGFPSSIPWAPLQHGTHNLLNNLLHYQPLLFLEWAQARYASEIKGYSLHFRKRELVGGKLQPTEKLEVHFRDEPFSVHMRWLDGARLAQSVLYVKGENNDEMLARLRGLLGGIIVSRDIHGADAKQSGRFTIDQFGFYGSTERTLASMYRAQARGALHLRFDGVYKVPELDDRPCYKLVRSPYEPLEEDELNELTLYFDQETWLQVGSILKNGRGELISEYYFRDVRLNPEFKKDQFTRSAL